MVEAIICIVGGYVIIAEAVRLYRVAVENRKYRRNRGGLR
ncbi:hypothetical protein SAMN05443247_01231 [Bradyrhizobium erythrophlei]|jgi:hypothetical protein|nr:hypothetical protein SAMN05443247_01231 [Bradyrhizobium erythrophlei]